MAVITISRGSFSGGKMLGGCLADKLGYRCIDRDVIVERAAAYGVPQEELHDALAKPPSFWDRFRHKRYVYLTLIQAALTEEVQHGKAVYHGNAGHLLLRGVSHVLRTRIIASMAYRVAAVQDRRKLSEAEALAHVQQMDQDRQKWTQYLYGVDWGDPSLYDVVVNLASIDIPGACDLIASAAAMPYFAETVESQAAMDNLVLASRVRATLARAPRTADLEVAVVARHGSVTIRGRLSPGVQFTEVEAIVHDVAGVTDVRLEVAPDIDV
ncbi:MAG: cytidylate kinase-like family protein [Acidobacteriota bacterium]